MIEIDYEDGRINLNRDSSEVTTIIGRTTTEIEDLISTIERPDVGTTTIISEPDLRGMMATDIDDSISGRVHIPRTEYKFHFLDPDNPEVAIECTEVELQRRVARDMEAERLFEQWFPNSTEGYDRDVIKKIPKLIAEDIVGTLIATYLIKWWNSTSTSPTSGVYMEVAMKLYRDFKIQPSIIQKKLTGSDAKGILDSFLKKLGTS